MKKLILLVVSFFIMFFGSKIFAESITVETYCEGAGPGIYIKSSEYANSLAKYLCIHPLRKAPQDLVDKLSVVNGKIITDKDKTYNVIKKLAKQLGESELGIDYYMDVWKEEPQREEFCWKNIEDLNKKIDELLKGLLDILIYYC